MSGSSRKLMGTTAAGADFLAVEDVFSTFLYTGNGSTQTITNGIDLAGEGGLVWIKERTALSLGYHALVDTERGATKQLFTNLTDAESSSTSGLTSFSASGFSLGDSNIYNVSGGNLASWTFRKAPRFFDVVTYTGDGNANRAIAHNLGTTVGSIFIKRTDTTRNWAVYHRSTTDFDYSLRLNTTDAQFQDNYFSAAPDDSNFYIDKSPGGDLNVNASGGTYVAYLFAHDPLGPSGDGSDGLIACGSYTGNGTSQEIDLGWEPQWLLFKNADESTEWHIVDVMRGWTTDQSTAILRPNQSTEELNITGGKIKITSTGFAFNDNSVQWNGSGDNFIYIAIRRGPMRAPESGTEVFSVVDLAGNSTGFYDAGLNPDLVFAKFYGGAQQWWWTDRMRGNAVTLSSDNTNAEAANSYITIAGEPEDRVSTIFANGNANATWNFRRAPGFFDVVAYTGTESSDRQIPHNLNVTPELMIVKTRNDIGNWFVYHKDLGDGWLTLNTTDAVKEPPTYADIWGVPTDTYFDVDFDIINGNDTYIAYLFATLPGVSKVGSYTGSFPTSTTQIIDCGFTTGARFILIKAASRSGAWAVWDSARGITVSDDPRLELNSTGAEQTQSNIDVEPHSSGFIIDSSSGEFNEEGETYIFYAIA